MALTKFELVNTNGLKGLSYKGDFLAFDKITDEIAEELITKTHVLKRKEGATVAPVVAVVEPEAEEAPATGRKARG